LSSVIKIGDIELIKQVQDTERGLLEFRTIRQIKVNKKRRLVEHKIIGMDGSIIQDIGRDAISIYLEGNIRGEQAPDVIKQLWEIFRKSEPVPFESTVTGIPEINKVLIKDLDIEDIGGRTNHYHYKMTLIEYIPPPKPEEREPPSQEEEAQQEAEEEADRAADKVNILKGKVIDQDGNPLKDIPVKIIGEDGEWIVRTNEEGEYSKEGLEPGCYTITIDMEEYAHIRERICIGETAREKVPGPPGEEEKPSLIPGLGELEEIKEKAEKLKEELEKKKEEIMKKKEEIEKEAREKIEEAKKKIEEKKKEIQKEIEEKKEEVEKKIEEEKKKIEEKKKEVEEKAEKMKEEAEEKAKEVKEKVEEKTEEVKEEAREKAEEVKEEAREKKEEVEETIKELKDIF